MLNWQGWAANFLGWASSAPVETTPAVTGGAGDKPKRKRRVLVTVGKETFEVGSEAEAVALLEQARELAQVTAERMAVKVAGKVAAKPRKVYPMEPPKLAIVRPDYGDLFVQQLQAQIDAAQAAIAETYRAALEAELRRRADDEEESIIALLLE